MIHNVYELLGLFFLYSFIGWIMETTAAATKQKRFINRGLINGPFCIIYGIGVSFVFVFGRELSGLWLFAGAFILTTMTEWIAGHLIESLYHERWWDYSDRRWNLDGYICFSASLIWTILAILGMKVLNPFFLRLFRFIPDSIFKIVTIVLLIILILDFAATVIILNGRSRRMEQWIQVDNWLEQISSKLGRKIYEKVDIRIRKAYPDVTYVEVEKAKPEIFAYGCSFDKIVWLLVGGAFLGDIVETIYCYVVGGVWMSRSSVVWGPFSLVWGIGVAAITLLFYRYRNRSAGFLFLLGTLLGGAYEYICSVFTEMFFGKVFWDYSWMPFNLGGRINLLYCFFWGFAAVAWFKLVLPKAEHWIEKVPVKIGKLITWCVLIFMTVNISVSCMALTRSTQREQGIPAEHGWQKVMDARFDDERMARIYPNAKSIE